MKEIYRIKNELLSSIEAFFERPKMFAASPAEAETFFWSTLSALDITLDNGRYYTSNFFSFKSSMHKKYEQTTVCSASSFLNYDEEMIYLKEFYDEFLSQEKSVPVLETLSEEDFQKLKSLEEYQIQEALHKGHLEMLQAWGNTVYEKRAACCVILKENKILTVSRKDDDSKFGLPGGKAEENESIEETCLRELKEETGMGGKIVKYVHTGYPDPVHRTLCFLVESNDTPEPLEGTKVEWKTPQELLDNSPFALYNKEVFEKLNIL